MFRSGQQSSRLEHLCSQDVRGLLSATMTGALTQAQKQVMREWRTVSVQYKRSRLVLSFDVGQLLRNSCPMSVAQRRCRITRVVGDGPIREDAFRAGHPPFARRPSVTDGMVRRR